MGVYFESQYVGSKHRGCEAAMKQLRNCTKHRKIPIFSHQ